MNNRSTSECSRPTTQSTEARSTCSQKLSVPKRHWRPRAVPLEQLCKNGYSSIYSSFVPRQFSQDIGEWPENQILIPDWAYFYCPGATLVSKQHWEECPQAISCSWVGAASLATLRGSVMLVLGQSMRFHERGTMVAPETEWVADTTPRSLRAVERK